MVACVEKFKIERKRKNEVNKKIVKYTPSESNEEIQYSKKEKGQFNKFSSLRNL